MITMLEIKTSNYSSGSFYYFYADNILTKEINVCYLFGKNTLLARLFDKVLIKDNLQVGDKIIVSLSKDKTIRLVNEKTKQKFINDNAELFV